jgi:hypothetical protein
MKDYKLKQRNLSQGVQKNTGFWNLYGLGTWWVVDIPAKDWEFVSADVRGHGDSVSRPDQWRSGDRLTTTLTRNLMFWHGNTGTRFHWCTRSRWQCVSTRPMSTVWTDWPRLWLGIWCFVTETREHRSQIFSRSNNGMCQLSVSTCTWRDSCDYPVFENSGYRSTHKLPGEKT